jgi:protein-S-isoprenylcysteine O-methyltransferase Ste14
MIGRVTMLVYGAVCYLVFFASFLYAIAFLGDFGVPKSIDSGRLGPVWQAVAIDAALLGLFAVQHSLMARQWFKKRWTQLVPAAAERSTYVLLSSVALAVLFWRWEPIGGIVWQVESSLGQVAIYYVYAAGWVLLLIATFLINHFDLFGLRQVYLNFRQRPYTGLKFRTPGLYRVVRHPIYFSWLCIFWATPRMTMAHLFFAVATTAYILMAIPWEERDLMQFYGETYRRYRDQVPGIIPIRLIGRQAGLGPRASALQSRESIPTIEYPGR